jgi:hypothetical protein
MKNLVILFIGILFLSLISCSNDEQENSISTLITNETTEANSETTYTTVKISGKIISGEAIISRGICWSTNPNPTI